MGQILARRQSPVTLTVLYFDGCPHLARMDEGLGKALRRIGRDETVERQGVVISRCTG
jgi:hypothetical protein